MTASNSIKKVCSVEGCSSVYKSIGYCGRHGAAFRRYGDPLYTENKKPKVCAVDGCNSKHWSKSYCEPHYKAYKAYGNPLISKRSVINTSICKVDGCSEIFHCKGYCNKHYQRLYKHGDPTKLLIRTDMAEEERFEDSCLDIPFSECQLWSGASDKDGYGLFSHSNNTTRAHRYQWIRQNGDIPDGLWVLHTCNNGHLGCVSIDHLRLGTARENFQDAVDAGTIEIKLTENKVRCVRLLALTGLTTTEIAKRYNMSRSNVSVITLRQTWKHVS